MKTPDIDGITVEVYRFPTPQPEADGTLTWDATTAVVVTVAAEYERGLGWTYSSPAAATVIERHLAPLLLGSSPDDIPDTWDRMHKACRNIGTSGVVAHAISAVDIALWDLKARLLELPLPTLFGKVREATAVYGSGGFVNLSDDQLAEQVLAWESAGCTAVKIKIGIDRRRDLERIALVDKLTGNDTQIMVDANGAYSPGEARRMGHELDRLGVTWFEEPVTSDDPAGLRMVRDALRCDVTAGEYICTAAEAVHLIDAVDCLQLDVTRCGGYTGFRYAASLAAYHHRDISAHCAPALTASIAASMPRLRHVEWFIDHARLEPLLVEGAPQVQDGRIPPRGNSDADPFGHGMRLAATAADYRISVLPPD
ncbi:enolase C-terminal domain-like protein [Nocardia sp. CDC160]|uniref:enolase C-terminal domain-like protein n=1 Tax=Nocardia sp. CDC160 TaxID=3112166 RepID=UPI002DBBB800|nr:enolase C-terminal domain-like protein [Nocardia sp. CDC160]MEC3919009.1 enolase C-terminal domain-like protein [Nocardia sp. CDC160]